MSSRRFFPTRHGQSAGEGPGLLSRALLSGLLLTLMCAAPVALAQKPIDESDLPETLRRGYVGPVVGPADDSAYARGALGLLRSSYGRASLYVAWRVMQLPAGALARERHERRGSWLQGGLHAPAPADELAGWLNLRKAVVDIAPAVAPDYFRVQPQVLAGGLSFEVQEGQCGPDAFAFATRTLQNLLEDRQLRQEERRHWVLGQDAVFARCSWTPGHAPLPPLPAVPPQGTAARLLALHEYQHASALFYGDEHAAAIAAFDAIAARPDHPMRPWATLAALRSVLRSVSRDAEWKTAVEDAWTRRGLRGAQFNAAVAQPGQRRQARVDAALKEIEVRFKAAMADASLAPVHPAIGYTVRRALLQLLPAVPLRHAMNALDKPDSNPYTMGALDLFQELYPAVAPNRPEGALAASLRKHEWFDFIQVVQACDRGPGAPDTATCEREHAHATSRWQQTRHNAWLLASLMTARRPAEGHLAAAEAARAVAADRPEWASLQFYAARMFLGLGRPAEARAALESLRASGKLHQRDQGVVEAQLRRLAT